jgi:hypothetical protein
MPATRIVPVSIPMDAPDAAPYVESPITRYIHLHQLCECLNSDWEPVGVDRSTAATARSSTVNILPTSFPLTMPLASLLELSPMITSVRGIPSPPLLLLAAAADSHDNENDVISIPIPPHYHQFPPVPEIPPPPPPPLPSLSPPPPLLSPTAPTAPSSRSASPRSLHDRRMGDCSPKSLAPQGTPKRKGATRLVVIVSAASPDKDTSKVTTPIQTQDTHVPEVPKVRMRDRKLLVTWCIESVIHLILVFAFVIDVIVQYHDDASICRVCALFPLVTTSLT